MLPITIPEGEFYNEQTGEFISIKETKLQLEHSLISLSKWESKWCKPFLSKEPKTEEQNRDYVRCMTINQNVDPLVYYGITPKLLEEISNYINAPMTATWFSEDKNKAKKNNEVITNELIYYWMVALQIPFECERWHINRLLTLIRICNIKNEPPKKMNTKDLLNRNKSLNAARRARLGSRG